MKKYYQVIALLSLIAVVAVIYAVKESGLPNETRGKKLDEQRVNDLFSLNSNIQSYYLSHQKLPQNLNEVNNTYSYKDTTDPETGNPYEYKITGPSSYQLCATFDTDRINTQNPQLNYSYYEKEFVHPKGYYCFYKSIKPSQIRASASPSPALKFEDKNIKLANSGFEYLSSSRQEYALFNLSDPKAGMYVAYAGEMSVFVQFNNPVKLKSVSVRFGGCAVENCYKWQAEGVTSSGETVTLVEETSSLSLSGTSNGVPFVQSTVNVDSTYELVKVKVSAEKPVEDKKFTWQKIFFTYDQ